MKSEVGSVRNVVGLREGVKGGSVRKRLLSLQYHTVTDDTSIDDPQAKTTELTHTSTCTHTSLIHEDITNVLSESIKQWSKHKPNTINQSWRRFTDTNTRTRIVTHRSAVFKQDD